VRAVVVAGSPVVDELDEVLISSADLVVAVDGGADALARIGLVPDLLVGDLDSISSETLADLRARGIQKEVLPTAKDETDTEAALCLVVGRGADEIVVYGALGGPRFDHMLGNILLLSAPWLTGKKVRLLDGRHEVFLAHGDATFVGQTGDVVSLLPLTPQVEAVATEGLQYPLAGETLHQFSTRSVSNRMIGTQARVTHGEGVLLIIRYFER
jgi:thiamine pyrophosphokinase